MTRSLDKIHAFTLAVHETYRHDGLVAALLGICWFFPTIVAEYLAAVTSATGK